jgi:hypothetical protein
MRPELKYRGLRFPRTASEAFRDAEYASGFEHHIAPDFWTRVVLFFKRRFA